MGSLLHLEPPEPLIAAEVDRNVRWVLTFAEKTPQVAIVEADASPVGSGGAIEVRATVANVGWMATATAQASGVLGTSQPVRAWLELENATIVDGVPVATWDVLPGTRGGAPTSRSVRWSVRALDPSRSVAVTVVVRSEKAGTVRHQVELTGNAP